MKQNLLVKSLLVLVIFGISFFSLANAAGPVTVGNGWNSITNYFVADWTGDGIPDLLVRNTSGDMLLFPFKNGTFYNAGGPIKVGNGWNSITDYFVADWTGDGISDLACQKNQWGYGPVPLQERHVLLDR